MDLPDGVLREVLALPSGRRVMVWKWKPLFERWTGDPLVGPARTYTAKPLIKVAGERYFAELAIRRSLVEHGWTAVWLDTFHNNKVWDGMIDSVAPEAIPPEVRAEYAPVLSVKGVWDVFAWKADRALFAESKGPSDKIRDNQIMWLGVASQSGLPLEFLIVDWSFESPHP
jgi:hypothetical protein